MTKHITTSLWVRTDLSLISVPESKVSGRVDIVCTKNRVIELLTTSRCQSRSSATGANAIIAARSPIAKERITRRTSRRGVRPVVTSWREATSEILTIFVATST